MEAPFEHLWSDFVVLFHVIGRRDHAQVPRHMQALRPRMRQRIDMIDVVRDASKNRSERINAVSDLLMLPRLNLRRVCALRCAGQSLFRLIL